MRRQLIIVSSISCLCLLAACSGEPSAPAPPEDKLVKGTFRAVPDLAVYREVTEADWKPLPMITPTSFQFSPKAPYLVTVVCEAVIGGTRFAYVQQFAQTPDDPGDLDVWCDPGGPYLVTGSLAQPGIGLISMRSVTGFFSGGDYGFLLQSGTYDLLAAIDGRFAARRGIEVHGDMTIANPLDLDLEGASLITPHFTVPNVASMEKVSSAAVDLYTRDGWLLLHSSSNFAQPIPVAPDRALLPSDVQTVTLYAQSGQSRRGVKRKYREGDSAVFTLPDLVDSVTLSQADGRPMATWATLPDHEQIRAHFTGRTADPSTIAHHFMTLSRSFEDAMGVSTLALDAAIPGYQPRWLIDVSKEYHQYWYAERDVGNDTLMSGASISVNVPAMSAGSPDHQPHDVHRRARAWHAP